LPSRLPLDVLSGGRLRLGVGIGWNHIEYISLGENFHNRGARSEEQVTVLRQLWTQPLVTFKGRWHSIPDAGLNPLPIQRPIPIWFGGSAETVMRRIARMGDGWLLSESGVEATRQSLEWLDRYLAEEGRDRSQIGLEPRRTTETATRQMVNSSKTGERLAPRTCRSYDGPQLRHKSIWRHLSA
jgi:alkanesulfonate monooxygenase SsuD/methylene tetrahydromethanopterin reductase-like flavin-dependent oxidoreductase (luciferase family)